METNFAMARQPRRSEDNIRAMFAYQIQADDAVRPGWEATCREFIGLQPKPQNVAATVVTGMNVLPNQAWRHGQ
ncbi:hypothetical protein O9929_08455 [Vibrio lentus]|nr:hypothetical protein [Vibrio lentus]